MAAGTSAADENDASLGERLRARAPRIPATWLLIAANGLVFGAMLFHGAGVWHAPNDVQLAWGANFGPATKDGEWWRLGSALFLHFGLLHLGLNMLALWEGGSFVERMYGPWRFLLIYLAAGLAGNLASLLARGDHAVGGGASGAIFGIYGALLVFLWIERRRCRDGECRWLFRTAAAFTAVSFGMGFVIDGIDHAAHLGGLICGALAARTLLPASVARPAAFAAGRLAAGSALALAVATMVANIPAPRYRWHEEEQARERITQFLADDRQISADWNAILAQGGAGASSFEQLAGRVDARVAAQYERTFEQLSSLRLNPNAPSAPLVDVLRRYSAARRDASRDLAEGLRRHDRRRIDESLERARRAAPQSRCNNGVLC